MNLFYKNTQWQKPETGSAPALIPAVDLKQHHSRPAHGRQGRLREKNETERDSKVAWEVEAHEK